MGAHLTISYKKNSGVNQKTSRSKGYNGDPKWEITQEELWERFRKGNRDAISRIYHEYVPFLFNYASQFTPDRDLVKDCIQDLFVSLCRRHAKVSPTDNIKAYLFKGIRREVVSKLQKRKKQEVAYGDMFLADPPPPRCNEKKRLTQAISQLPPRQREAVMLYFYEGFDYQEITKIMRFTLVKSARKLVYRSIDSLKIYLSK